MDTLLNKTALQGLYDSGFTEQFDTVGELYDYIHRVNLSKQTRNHLFGVLVLSLGVGTSHHTIDEAVVLFEEDGLLDGLLLLLDIYKSRSESEKLKKTVQRIVDQISYKDGTILDILLQFDGNNPKVTIYSALFVYHTYADLETACSMLDRILEKNPKHMNCLVVYAEILRHSSSHPSYAQTDPFDASFKANLVYDDLLLMLSPNSPKWIQVWEDKFQVMMGSTEPIELRELMSKEHESNPTIHVLRVLYAKAIIRTQMGFRSKMTASKLLEDLDYNYLTPSLIREVIPLQSQSMISKKDLLIPQKRS